jgi:hypothetical protein
MMFCCSRGGRRKAPPTPDSTNHCGPPTSIGQADVMHSPWWVPLLCHLAISLSCPSWLSSGHIDILRCRCSPRPKLKPSFSLLSVDYLDLGGLSLPSSTPPRAAGLAGPNLGLIFGVELVGHWAWQTLPELCICWLVALKRNRYQ